MRLRNRCRRLLALALLACAPATAHPQEAETQAQDIPALDRLAADAVALIAQRYSRPLGRVVDRQRRRVFVSIDGDAPPLGATLAVLRRTGDAFAAEQLIAHLQVTLVGPGIVECSELERTGRAHAERDDVVRLRAEPARVLLAPCATLIEMPAAIPQILGEKLRTALRTRLDLELVDDAQRQAQALQAYTAKTVPDFLQGQGDLDEVLFPVLLRTSEKLVLHVEYHSVPRRLAVDIAVASVGLDGVLNSWLQARGATVAAPPGFQHVSTQAFRWRILGLGEITPGLLAAVTRDTLRVLRFESPGLRPGAALFLGPRERTSRGPYVLMLPGASVSVREAAAPRAWILSVERWPTAIGGGGDRPLQLLPRGTGLELRPQLEALWTTTAAAPDLASRWWPAPGRGERPVIWPLFLDLDDDARVDALWSDRRGTLRVQRSATERLDLFRGFGDVKAAQAPADSTQPAVLWLTDPVCCGAGDRLHAAQLEKRTLRLMWSSERFAGTIAVIAGADLNGDGSPDLVVAEHVAAESRLHVYLALPARSPR